MDLSKECLIACHMGDLNPWQNSIKMRLPNHNFHAQPTAGSSSCQPDVQPMQNAMLERDELIAQLLQEAEDEEQAKENPWGSNNHKTDKGKGRLHQF
ncbi:hypothetical protein O181_075581 [Austropuccinia psidii MF-1]|uniref:Uncharacterized protein n=1 Tax=Austropuccinia psidii MF-1 TaxID=1389203 RepID=A0A9Q3FEU7_9BASI|nr:hypothetical protein [Austropuccinia psidii MF-1]